MGGYTYSVALMLNFIYSIQLFKQRNILHSCRSVGPGLKYSDRWPGKSSIQFSSARELKTCSDPQIIMILIYWFFCDIVLMLKEGAKCTKISKVYLFQSCINLEIEAPLPAITTSPCEAWRPASIGVKCQRSTVKVSVTEN